MFYFVFVVPFFCRCLSPWLIFLKDYNHWNPKEIELHDGFSWISNHGKVSLSKINLEVGSFGFRDDEMVV